MSVSLSSTCLVRQCAGSRACGQRAIATASKSAGASAPRLKWLPLHRAISAMNGQQLLLRSMFLSLQNWPTWKTYFRSGFVDELLTPGATVMLRSPPLMLHEPARLPGATLRKPPPTPAPFLLLFGRAGLALAPLALAPMLASDAPEGMRPGC